MTRINAAVSSNTFIDWIQRNQEEIQTHPAWHAAISENESEDLLRGQSTLTYLLRPGQENHAYFISFVKQDGSIKHQLFTLEFSKQGWYYRNGSCETTPTEIISKDIHELIPLMMHCDSSFCIPLGK